jgi:exonuclease III
MAKFLKLAVWNVNGLINHRDELKMFFYTHDIDVMLISETHFTEKSYIRIPQYILVHYHTNHPAGTAQGGTAIILRKLHPAPPIKSLQPSFPSSNQCASRRHHRPPHNFRRIPPSQTHHIPYIKSNWKNVTTLLDTGS